MATWSPPGWTKELDLQLIQLLQQALSSDYFDADKSKFNWQAIFESSSWPPGFTRDSLKHRWEDSYRRWPVNSAPRNLGNRAKLVKFSDLTKHIEDRGIGTQ